MRVCGIYSFSVAIENVFGINALLVECVGLPRAYGARESTNLNCGNYLYRHEQQQAKSHAQAQNKSRHKNKHKN